MHVFRRNNNDKSKCCLRKIMQILNHIETFGKSVYYVQYTYDDLFSTSQNNVIVFTVDSNIEHNKFLRNAIQSCRIFNHDIKIIILTTLNNNVQDIIQRFDNIEIYHLDNDPLYLEFVDGRKNTIDRISKMAFTRLIIPLMDIFKNYNKVLYVDCDVEFLQNINSIFYDNTKSFIYMTPEVFLTYKRFDMIKASVMNKAKYRYMDGVYNIDSLMHQYIYYNAGVILFNMDMLPKEYSIKLKQAISSFDTFRFTFQDQDILNIFYNAYIKELDPKYNVSLLTTTATTIDELHNLSNIYIRHFITPDEKLELKGKLNNG